MRRILFFSHVLLVVQCKFGILRRRILCDRTRPLPKERRTRLKKLDGYLKRDMFSVRNLYIMGVCKDFSQKSREKTHNENLYNKDDLI